VSCCNNKFEVETDDGEVIYPDLCECICHTEDDCE
jgi:hypothetical protein